MGTDRGQPFYDVWRHTILIKMHIDRITNCLFNILTFFVNWLICWKKIFWRKKLYHVQWCLGFRRTDISIDCPLWIHSNHYHSTSSLVLTFQKKTVFERNDKFSEKTLILIIKNIYIISIWIKIISHPTIFKTRDSKWRNALPFKYSGFRFLNCYIIPYFLSGFDWIYIIFFVCIL